MGNLHDGLEIEDVGDFLDSIGRGHHKGKGARAWDYKEFISFDGEGITFDEPFYDRSLGYFEKYPEFKLLPNHIPQPQTYVLLGNSKGDRISCKDGLATIDCFEYMIECKRKYPDSIFVAFAFNYDINQMLKDVPRPKLKRLHEKGEIRWRNYWISWRPGKSFIVSHRPSKRSMIIYDTFGFFQKSLLDTCQAYVPDDPQLELIKRGKESRSIFEWEELDEFIIPYNDAEMNLHVKIMNLLRNDLHSIGIDLSLWHGPGAIAQKVFHNRSIPITRDIPEEILDASQFAYAGGRFELLQMGRHPDTVYEYDINSAYPAAATLLPDISRGSWEHVESFEHSSFGIWYCDYTKEYGNWELDNRPQPLFCRSVHGNISYPNTVSGWYWTPEALHVPDYIKEGYVFRPDTDSRPFEFIREMYDDRRTLKDQKNPAERAVKLGLNSFYGKLAQRIGYGEGPPRWHQLEYAGFITSYTRAMIWEAIKLNPTAIIATETDAVFSTEPLDLPLSNELGDWKQTTFDEIVYLQSGFYYALQDSEVHTCTYRGMDKDKTTGQPLGLPYKYVIDKLKGRGTNISLSCPTTRFVGIGNSLNTHAVWRSWERKSRTTHLFDPKRKTHEKRVHVKDTCAYCDSNVTMYERLHPLEIGGSDGKSYARELPWRTVVGQEDPDLRQWIIPWQA